MADNDGSRTRVGAGTWIQGSMCVAIIVATAFVVRLYYEVTSTQATLIENSGKQATAIENLSDDMYRIRVDLNTALDDPWHQRDMKFWVLSAQQAIDRAGLKVELPPVQAVESAPKPAGPRK